VDLTYLKHLHTNYEDWLNQPDSEKNVMCPILILNGNSDKKHMNDMVDKAITTILRIAKEKHTLMQIFSKF
jgi:deoxyadenosine/deoxycytidine kinase